MFSIKIVCFMFNFSFKGDTLYRLIPSGDRLIHPPDSLKGDTISRDTGSEIVTFLVGRRRPHQDSSRAECGPRPGRCAPLVYGQGPKLRMFTGPRLGCYATDRNED